MLERRSDELLNLEKMAFTLNFNCAGKACCALKLFRISLVFKNHESFGHAPEAMMTELFLSIKLSTKEMKGNISYITEILNFKLHIAKGPDAERLLVCIEIRAVKCPTGSPFLWCSAL